MNDLHNVPIIFQIASSIIFPDVFKNSNCIAKADKNIARGTTDPEIDSVTWIELGNNIAPLTLVASLTT